MIRFVPIALLALVVGSQAMAQDQDLSATTTAQASEVTKGLFDKVWSVTPRVGIFGFEDGTQNYTSRIMEGITTNLDLSSSMSMPSGTVLGLESGILYSHAGSPGATFFGSSTNVANNYAAGNNMFLVPINATLGYKTSDKSLVALDLGADMVYASAANAVHFGRAGDANIGSQTQFFPAAGLNFAWALSKSVGLSLRGDYIPTPAQDLFTGTLGAVIGLG